MDTRGTILSIGMEMISLQGYNATGIDSVLKKAGVPKGSFYHYFESKEDFGLAIIDQFADRYTSRLKGHLCDPGFPPLDRIRNYLLDGQKAFVANSHAKGCLIGNLGQEMADQNDRFRSRLDEVFAAWKGLIAVCLREAQSSGSLPRKPGPTTMAEFILSGWEGALLRAKVTKSPGPLADFIEVLFKTTLRQQEQVAVPRNGAAGKTAAF